MTGLEARAAENTRRMWEQLGYEVDELRVEPIRMTASYLVEAIGWRDEQRHVLSAVVEPDGADWNITDLTDDDDPFRGL